MSARLVVIAALLVAPSLAGCQGKSVAVSGATTSAVGSTHAAPPSPSSTSGVPTVASLLPDGVYRSHVGYALLDGLDADPSDAGTWTLTVKAATYRLTCAPISDPHSDCGNDGASSLETVELGTLRGTGSTVWFVHDQAALSKLNGCVIGSQEVNGCGADGGYRATWALRGRSLTFHDFTGLGDEADEPAVNEKTAQPWTRIS